MNRSSGDKTPVNSKHNHSKPVSNKQISIFAFHLFMSEKKNCEASCAWRVKNCVLNECKAQWIQSQNHTQCPSFPGPAPPSCWSPCALYTSLLPRLGIPPRPTVLVSVYSVHSPFAMTGTPTPSYCTSLRVLCTLSNTPTGNPPALLY